MGLGKDSSTEVLTISPRLSQEWDVCLNRRFQISGKGLKHSSVLRCLGYHFLSLTSNFGGTY